jgi:hypothetical protein
VFEDADAGVERKPGKDDAACGHDENLGGTAGIVRRQRVRDGALATIRPCPGVFEDAGAVNKG